MPTGNPAYCSRVLVPVLAQVDEQFGGAVVGELQLGAAEDDEFGGAGTAEAATLSGLRRQTLDNLLG